MNKYFQLGHVSSDDSPIIRPDGERSISQNLTLLNTLVHDVINLLYYEHWTDKQKYFYVASLLAHKLWLNFEFESENEKIVYWVQNRCILVTEYMGTCT